MYLWFLDYVVRVCDCCGDDEIRDFGGSIEVIEVSVDGLEISCYIL